MNCDLISRYRKQLMGFATIWVAFLHASMWFRFVPLQAFKLTGHGGVDMFLFLSGFGMYYAWQKGERGLKFWLRRMIRILPAFLIAAVGRILYLHLSAQEAWLLLSTLAFWLSYDRSMWYISAIVVLYAVTPFYLKWFGNEREEKMTGYAILCGVLLGLLFHNTNQMIFFARIPIYFVGILAGKYSYDGEILSKKARLILFASLAVGFALMWLCFSLDHNENLLWGWGMYWYPALLTTWPLCLYLAKAGAWLEHVHFPWIGRLLDRFGEISLEFYLLHELSIRFWSNIFTVNERYSGQGIVFNLLVFFLTYWLASAMHAVIEKLLAWLKGKRAAA